MGKVIQFPSPVDDEGDWVFSALYKNRFPDIDRAIRYVTFPHDGKCDDVEKDIICPLMDYTENDSLFVTGVSSKGLECFMRDVAKRCKELEETCKPLAMAYSIDIISFYPKDIFLLASYDIAAKVMPWILNMEDDDIVRMGMTSRIDPETNRAIVPILF